LAKALAQADAQEIVATVKSKGSVTLRVDGEDTLIKEEYLDVRISAKEGFNVQMENNIFVVLDTALDEKLIAEGCAREIISKVQQMRKQNGYEVLDQIVLYINGDEKIQKAVETFKDFIKSETLTAELVLTDDELTVQSINGHETGIKVEKK
jgi:isoleucyl-tRNA synthetase